MKGFAKWLLPLSAVAALHAQPASYHDPFNDPFFQDPFGDEIFKEMMQMQRQMDALFNRMHMRIQQRQQHMAVPYAQFGAAMQSGFVDKGDHYELYTHIPQSKDNKIDIQTGNGMIEIHARIVHEEKQNNNGFVSTSRSEQMISQALSLPADADENKIDTAFENGMLVIKIAKKPKAALTQKQAANTAPQITIRTPATSASAKNDKNATAK